MPWLTAVSTSSPTLPTACKMLNWLCACRWMNGTSSLRALAVFGAGWAVAAWGVVASKFAASSLGASYTMASRSSISGRWMTRRRHSSKKHLAVASTSYAASWASSNPVLKSLWWSSVSVGHLNWPPRPPGMAQKSVASFLESITGLSVSFSEGWANRWYSAPTMLTSNSMLWPTT